MAAKTCLQTGITLIELIIAIVIMGLALSGVLSAINQTNQHSADPVLELQAIQVAEAYLEEIQLQAFIDPDGTDIGETRATFDDVDDYNGLQDLGAHDQQGMLISVLKAYEVNVAVTNQTVNGQNAKEITVTVTPPSIPALSLVGYKFNG